MGLFTIKSVLTIASRALCTQKKVETMKYLCVAEKNDAAKNIAKFLSRGASNRREGLSPYNKIYEFDCQVFGQQSKLIMTSVSGHLLTYAFVSTFKKWNSCNPVTLFDAPVHKVCPEDYIKIKKTLEREIKYCGGLIIWTDCDREGENIGFEIIKVCTDIKPNLRVYRAKFSEITAASVTRALNDLREPNKNVNDAVDVRQELDLRTGAAFTRLQTLRLQKVFPGSLSDKLISYGSCQFPTLGFVVERYQAIEDFIPEKFWKIKMNHVVKELTTDFLWKRERLFSKSAVEAILDVCQEEPVIATVENVESKPKNKWRPLPLDTVEMEKIISRKLRINAKDTMKIAEKLYTQGLISYPRTETNIFPKELNLRTLVEQQAEDNRWGEFANRVLNNGGPNPRQGKKSDQAHPPIHPTKYINNLSGDEGKVYEYIVRHFLACVSKDALGHETIVSADIKGEKFTAKGLMILERNYLDVYIYEKWNAKEINQYQQGDTFTPTELDIVESSTCPPKLLTESELIALMEKHGIGTDATHAEHIEKIKSREYVGMHENLYFVPATLGMGLVEGYNNIGLQVSLAKPTLRAEFENDLKLICEGRKNAEEVRLEQIQKYREVFKTVAEKMRLLDDSLASRLNDRPQEYEEPQLGTLHYNPVFKCPKCGGDLLLRDRANGQGKFISCTSYPNCKNAIWLPSSVTNAEVTDQTCSICGPNIKKLKIQFRQNPFIGEPNPNILCIGGCDAAVLSTLDIPLSSVKKQTTLQPQPSTNSNNYNNPPRNSNNDYPPRQTNQRPPQNQNTLNNWVSGNQNSSNTNNDSGFGSRNNSTNHRPSGNTSSMTQNKTSFNTSGVQLLPTGNNNRNSYGGNNSFNRTGVPLATGDEEIVCHCGQPGLLLTVRKEGPNQGKQFFKCNQGNQGSGGCDFFLWAPEEGRANTSNANMSLQQDANDIKCDCLMAAVKRTVNKEGPNKGRQFFCCSKPIGQGCKFFKWADEVDDTGGGGDDGWGGGGGGGNTSWSNNKWKGKTSRGRGGSRAAPYKNQTRGKRKCGICGEEGHTRNKCPNN